MHPSRGIRKSLHQAAVLALLLGSILLLPQLASASAFSVDSTADTVDASPGDGACADASGDCSLRAAIMEANALAGPDTISLPAGTYTLALPGTDEDAAASGDLDVTDDLTLTGAGATQTILNGADLDRLLDILGATTTVALADLTITNGGGAILEAGGLRNAGELSLTRVTIDANDSGGLLNSGTATLNQVTLSDNTSGVAGLCGHGACNSGTMTIQDSTFSGASQYALWNTSTLTLASTQIEGSRGLLNAGPAVLDDVTFIDAVLVNWCANLTFTTGSLTGAGITNWGTLTLTDVTVSGTSGPAIDNRPVEVVPLWGTSCRGDLTLQNITLSGAGGPGLANLGDASLAYSTIAGNAAWGLDNQTGGTADAANTIIAGNTSGACNGGLTSLGHNLDDDGSCALAAAGDQSGVDPRLGPLQDNGGPALTHALRTGSPAIDAADNGACPPADARGQTRPRDGDGDGFDVCDAGAYERNAPIFTDVAWNHWARDEIESLYRRGYVAGCSASPLAYCPDLTLTRTEVAVFVERGAHGPGYLPPDPTSSSFDDVPLGWWGSRWIEALFADGYTAGCATSPPAYCPNLSMTRTEGSVFFERMLHGPSYVPPDPSGLFADVPTGWWGARWAEAAYLDGLIDPCSSGPPALFCPDAPADRGMVATMMVRALGLTIP